MIGTGRLGEKQLASSDSVSTDFLDNMTFRVLDGKKKTQRHRQVCRNLALFIFRGEVEENAPPPSFCASAFPALRKSANVQLSWVTFRVPDGREVMIPASTTDGSVTAGGNTLIVRSYSVYIFFFFHPFTLRPFDVSSGKRECPVSERLISVLSARDPAAGLRVFGGRTKVNRAPLSPERR